MVKKSIVLSAIFPSSKTGPDLLGNALDRIRPFDIPVVEYYTENCGADRAAILMSGWESVFLSAALQKQMNLNPSSPEPGERTKAIALLADSMRFAEQAGAGAVLLNSGTRPPNDKKDADCIRHLRESLCELHHMVGGVNILLEPGDRDVEYRHLIGHTDIAAAFIQDIKREIPNISLVFDMSHIAQLGETLDGSWNLARESCTHVHLANCSLIEGSQFYGDKHPPFGIEGGIYSHDDARDFYHRIEDEMLLSTVGVEIICPDEFEVEFFGRIAAEMGWFFQAKDKGLGINKI